VRPIILAVLLAASANPIHLELVPSPGRSFDVVWSGPAEGAGAGPFRGEVAMDGSPAALAISGRAERTGDRLTVRAAVPYADVPADWAAKFRAEGFDYRLRGRVGDSAPIAWSGRLPWDAIGVAGDAKTLSRFLKLTSFELTSFSLKRSEGRAVLRADNPFSFPLTIASILYSIEANGHAIGRGATRGRMLRARKVSAVELPFEVDHGEFLAAVGSAFAIGGDVHADLRGFVSLRFPSGDVRVPIRFSGELSTSGARSGVFAPPDGATSLSPR
jgi:LEA14-like dessication related protein